MILYFVQVISFQLLFLVSYDLFLKKETFFNWNRAYLICSSLLSFILPFIKIESFQKAIPQEYIVLLPEIILTPEKAVEIIVPSWNWYLIIGIAISSILFIYKISQLVRLKLKGIIVHQGSYKIIKIPNSTMAFSIFNYVFIGDDIEEEKLEDILSHELVHIREKHSLDLLYFELLRILFWFNPLVYIYQKRISELHEFIADATVVKHKNKSDYYEKLLAEVFQTQHFSFTNQFFKHSLIKKRISMLTKQKSREILKLKYLVLIPVLLLTLLYTSCNNSAETDIDPKASIAQLEINAKTTLDNFNTFSKSLKGIEILSEKQYTELGDLMKLYFEAQRTLSIAKGNEPEALSKLERSYEDYLKGRKASIAETNSYETVEQDAFEFKMIDKAPVFPGCEGEATLEDLKDCFSKTLQRHIGKNFNLKLAEELGLVGMQKLFVKFVVNKNGEIKDMVIRAPHPQLKAEVERVFSTLPKLTPAEKDGKQVSVKYMLPISFKIH
jgi:bla regulator protein BlaR1